MVLLEIVRNQIKLLFKNKAAFIAAITLPIVITALFSIGINNNEEVMLYIVDQDNSIYSKQFISMLEQEENIKVAQSNEADIRKRLDNQKISLAGIIKKGFGKDLISGNQPKFEILEAYENVNNIMLKFTLSEKLATIHKIFNDINYVGQKISLYNTSINKEEFIKNSFDSIMKEREKQSTSYVNYKTIGTDYKSLDMTSQSLLGYLVMFLCFSVIQGIRTLIEEKENRTFKRLLCTPVNIDKYIFGKGISIYIYGVVQIVTVLFAGKYLFHISWISNSFLIIGTLLSMYLFSVIGIVMIFIPFIKTQQQLSAISYLVIIITSMLGGTFFQIEVTSKIMQTISKCTLQGWAMKGLTDVIVYNGNFHTIMWIIISFAGIGIVGMLFSVILIRWQLDFQKTK